MHIGTYELTVTATDIANACAVLVGQHDRPTSTLERLAGLACWPAVYEMSLATLYMLPYNNTKH